jgi:acetyl-CoA acetyltransferase
MSHSIRGRTAVAGIGTFNVGNVPGFNPTENMAGAALRAIADAGLQIGDVDAVFSATGVHAFPTLSVCEYLGIRPRFVGGVNTGGSSFEIHIMEAALALEAGLCDVALICYGSNQASAGGRLVSMAESQWQEEAYQPRHPITGYALAAARHMHVYGTTRRQLAEVAVAARAWANLNPDACARGSLSIEDVLNARMVSDPLTSRDCCLVTDGGGAIVMVRAERARDLPNRPVHFLGSGMAQWHRSITEMPDLTVTAATESGPRAFEMAGVGRSEVDLVMVYDAFTINTILFLEDLGFCPKGEGGRFVEGGAIGPGGRLAVNTSGGGLSCMHPGMYGLFLIIEAVTQLRGAAGERQLPTPHVALCHANGGALSSQVTAIFGTPDTV